ncbi:MAG: nucleotidyltransferase domain-containing protein [Candidatus Methylomirabilis oxygeniifera]|uniref:Putative DNA polymerase, beta-like region n=1 Tax=Methylomirabilis oxygeniifera TaxID=671143 RepID=D5MII8_METO1|nr:MAG: nucleotidyltransferase domain-containing protein [Candidatus Methylomirabilis oxyfera]CBE67338.1 putative DNA polymerase, beta-like region [Candidatus Methylomirabilis oxyfera]
MSPPHTDVDPVLHTFASTLRARLGNHIRHIVLFGSRARGEAREDSDYDVLVIVDQRSPDVRSIILEIEADLMDRYGALVASILRTDAEWRVAQGLPLARNIALEGVPL